MNVKLNPGAFAPIRAHKTDAGADLRSPVTVTIYPGESVTIEDVRNAYNDGYACGMEQGAEAERSKRE